MFSPTFFVSSLVVIMTPGPDLGLITRLVFAEGRLRPAVAAAVGMITAGAAQLVIGVLGVAALLAAEPTLFTGLRWAGAGVLVVVAVLALRSALRRPDPVGGPRPEARPPGVPAGAAVHRDEP
jgi:threonine/homoserine/homoserine lactone efflux protein